MAETKKARHDHSGDRQGGMVEATKAAAGEDEVAKAALAVTMGKMRDSQRGPLL
ncbi:hypothetical protein [Bradyrhizobium sp. Ai1a-2]|uniref:hypothetical protein n=1 Tax=Bradyrhizobium sp. Ai1a-2 TaxID=196490 RepID=UPI000419C2E2|nr:hypothetical protein [Bradyrhizobium sp. Ai1a-2]